MIHRIQPRSSSEIKSEPINTSFHHSLARIFLIFLSLITGSSNALISKSPENVETANDSISRVSNSRMRKIDFNLYRSIQAEQGIDSSFIHVEKVMDAVKSKQSSFEAIELKNIHYNNKTVLEEFLSQKFQRTVFQYDLKKDRSFHSFDHIKHLSNLITISESSFVKCESSMDESIQIKDVIISSKEGYTKTLHESSTSIPPNVHSFMTSAQMKRHKGFLLIREVRSKEALSLDKVSGGLRNCYKYRTNDLHPLEIFHEFSIQSSISPPIKDMFPGVFEPGLTHKIFHDRLIHLQGSAPCTDGFFRPGDSCSNVCVTFPWPVGPKCAVVCLPPPPYLAGSFNGFAFSVGATWFCVD